MQWKSFDFHKLSPTSKFKCKRATEAFANLVISRGKYLSNDDYFPHHLPNIIIGEAEGSFVGGERSPGMLQ